MTSDKSPTSWKMEVIADSSGKWCTNSLRFSSEAEAEAYARDLAGRWTSVREHRVVPSDDPLTARWADGKVVHLGDPNRVPNTV